MLAEANTIQSAKELKNLALTAADWARRKGMGEQTILHCQSYALEAERKMGEMLDKTERAKPPNPKPPKDRRSHDVTDDAPTLASLGLTKRESAEAQALAEVPQAEFEKIKSGRLPKRTAINRMRRKKRKAALSVIPWPAGKYRVIYADPAWSYNDKRLDSGAEGHYETETLEAICAKPVRDLSLPDSVLFLWVTSPLLPDGLRVMAAWGFDYKASFIWDKQRGFNGHYNDVQHEILLIGIRGSCPPDSDKLFASIISERKTGHSVKPDRFRQIIDAMYPAGPRVELYARQKAKGWDVWGNEV